jgi:hypothetical protein
MTRAVCVAALVFFATALRASDPPADPPYASFVLADGWVDFVLERDGQPVADARVTVLVRAEVWARGETGPTGRGTFPRPPGRDCQVVFDLGAGPSAPVPLAFLDEGTVIPTRSPVLDGTAECCVLPTRSKPASRQSPEPSATLRDRLVIGVAVVVVNGLWLAWALRRGRRDEPNPYSKRKHTRERR